MQICPNCSERVRHYSTRALYGGKRRRYYKCSCGTKFITMYQCKEVIIKIST
ncbi:hypothetical protein PM10SUCC1_02420 [Propionigenium maris DSM 9537]|uniref:Uncharacterized protein n=1 Tax=Propionigenium maris DSM 9537 TaxID=1123000 RepID=A0A9W6GIK3_9FUSO|nr:hypothetical protein [Propionigenium maris]GLI54727.1 hypothetical protein PM10SUCC1_02420 [Propionigenium maris DSM 9537]